MDLNELAAEIEMMKQQNADRFAAEEQNQFIDKFGTMFSGDEGIGIAVLAEMNRRGVSSAAVGADRAVQEILDGLRMEASALLDKIKINTAEVNDLLSQVGEIQGSVEAATGASPGPGLPEPGMLPPLDDAGLPPLDGTSLPPEDDAGLPPLPPDGELPPLPPEGEDLPPEAVPSDKRLKLNLKPKTPVTKKTIPSDRRLKIKPKAPAATSWKPSSNLLGAIQGGK